MCLVFSYMNRMVDAFAADVSPAQAQTLAGMLDKIGGGVERFREAKPWTRFAGRLPAPLQAELEQIRQGEGDCPAELRSAIEARVAGASGGDRSGPTALPDEVAALADTLCADAHGVTDAHIANLKRAGWSEEAIYEMIYVASFAAAVGRMERAVGLLARR